MLTLNKFGGLPLQGFANQTRSSFPGEGLVLLLHGASSVGKKSTAGKLEMLLEIHPFYHSLCHRTDCYISTASIARMVGVPLLHFSTGKRTRVELMANCNIKECD